MKFKKQTTKRHGSNYRTRGRPIRSSQEKPSSRPAWDTKTDSSQTTQPAPLHQPRKLAIPVLATLLVLVTALALFTFFSSQKEKDTSLLTSQENDELAPQNEASLFNGSPNEIAKAFADETDPAKRLQYVRNSEVIARRMSSYPDQALREPIESFIKIPIIHTAKTSYARFVASFKNNEMRLLCVVATPEGPKVDWDCFARYTSASWSDILSGKAPSPEVRIFAKQANYYNYGYHDQDKWSCYTLSSPDTNQVLHAYVPRNSPRDRLLKKSLANTDLNQPTTRFTLRLKSTPEHPERKQFLIEEILALGWVKTEQSSE